MSEWTKWTAGHLLAGLAVACAVVAVPLGLFAEWKAFPFVVDGGLGCFVNHLDDLRPASWLLVLLGAGFAGYLGLGFRRKQREQGRRPLNNSKEHETRLSEASPELGPPCSGRND